MNIVPVGNTMPAMSNESIAKVYALENYILQLPQIDLVHTHTLHGGVYTRTVFLPAGSVITGALIKVPTTLIISGDVIAYFGDTTLDVKGYKVLSTEAGRKTAFAAIGDTLLAMIFKTDAKTIEEAEECFTDECDRLMTRKEK